MIPGLHRFGRSPGILDAYQQLHELFVNSSFNEEELTVVWQSINVEHACHYCVPAHRYRCWRRTKKTHKLHRQLSCHGRLQRIG
jgi:hypothetical protein